MHVDLLPEGEKLKELKINCSPGRPVGPHNQNIMQPLFDLTTDRFDTALAMNRSGTLVARSASTTRQESVVDVHRVIDGAHMFSYTSHGYWVISLCYIHRSGEDRLLVAEASVHWGRGVGSRCTELDSSLRVIRRVAFTSPDDSQPPAFAKALYCSATDEIIAMHSEHLLVYKYADFSLCRAVRLPDFYSTAFTVLADEQSCMIFCPNVQKMVVYCISDLTLMSTLYIDGSLSFKSFTCFPSGCILGCTRHGDAFLLDEHQKVIQTWNNVCASTSHKSSTVLPSV